MSGSDETAAPRGRRDSDDEEQPQKYSPATEAEIEGLNAKELALKALKRAERAEERARKAEEENEDLRSTIEEKDEKIEQLQRALAEQEREGKEWREDHEKRHDAKSNWMENIDDRVADIEEGQIDLSAADVMDSQPESVIPIQQMYNTCKAGYGDSLSKNERLAARVWPHYRKAADPSGGKLTVKSPKIREILSDELGIKRPNPNTIRRVMDRLAKFSGETEDGEQFIKFYTQAEDGVRTNKLECDRSDWKAIVTEGMMDDAKERLREQRTTNPAVAD